MLNFREKYGPGSGHVEAFCEECQSVLEAKFYDHPTDPKDKLVVYECSCGKTVVKSEVYHRSLDYKRKELEEEKLDKLVTGLSNYVNQGGSVKKFAERFSQEHRTLQQNFTRLCMGWFEKLASLDEYQYDGRNEASHKLAKRIVALEDKHLPTV